MSRRATFFSLWHNRCNSPMKVATLSASYNSLSVIHSFIHLLTGISHFSLFQRKEPGPESKRTMILLSKMEMSQALRDVSL